MNYFLEYEKLRNLHELYEDARDLCVSFGTPIENFAQADAKWKEVMSEAYKKVSVGIASKASTLNAIDTFVDANETVIPPRYLTNEYHLGLLEKYTQHAKESSKKSVSESEVYPLTIVSDRYGGCYSDGQYLALNCYACDVPNEIGGCDGEEMVFFGEGGGHEKYKIGKGATPDEALADLARLLSESENVE